MDHKEIEVVIIGIGQTAVGELWDVSLRDLAVQAVQAARKDSGGFKPNAVYVGNYLAASGSRQANLGALITEYAGLIGTEGVTVEAADASGGAAVRMAYTDVLGSENDALIAQMLDADYEATEGLTPAAQAALLMNRYIYENQVPREALAGFPLVAHANGANNPFAMYKKAISKEAYLRAGMQYPPLNLFDVAPYADGAAAVIMTRKDLVPPGYPHLLVKVSGASLIVDRLALHDREDPLFFSAAGLSVQKACEQAGIQPSDVDFFEYADITSLHAILSLEAAGFSKRGEGWRLATDSTLTITGSLPVATMGGYKARGHALGASGVYQAVEAVLQLRHQAGLCQVPNAKRGMIQCLGGLAGTAVTHILERVDD